MNSDEDDAAELQEQPAAQTGGSPSQDEAHSRMIGKFLRGLGANLRCGLRLAFFRPITASRLSVSVEQLIALVLIDLLLTCAADFLAAGGHGRFNLWALPGALFYLPLTLLAGYLIGCVAREPRLALTLPVALLSAGQCVSIATIALYSLGSDLDLSHHAVYVAYYWGPFIWWMAIVCFALFVLVPARLRTRLCAILLAGALVFAPAWLLPRSSVGALWVAADDDDASDTSSRYDTIASEEAFYAQPELLRRALSKIVPGAPGEPHLYFVGVAGDAAEDVFEKEVSVVSKLMQERFGTAGRSISLVNNPSTVLRVPLASRTSLSRTLAHIGKVMNRDQDVLFLYLTSHGSEDHRIALSFSPLRLRDLDPSGLREILDASRIRWRIVVVSACYAGGFIEPLKSDTTLVITAADAQHTSFGCGSESDFTYFGKAYFDQALREQRSFTAAFNDALRMIEARERGEGKAPSNPQMFVGSAMREKLKALEEQLGKP